MSTALKASQYGRQGIARYLWRWLRKYVAVLQVSIASNLAYIAEVFFRALLLVVLVFILAQLWKTTFSARGAVRLSGFSISDMIWYLVATHNHMWDMSLVLLILLLPHPLGVGRKQEFLCHVHA
jgi:hypothetical protein